MLFYNFFLVTTPLVAVLSVFNNDGEVPINNEYTEAFDYRGKLVDTGETIWAFVVV